MNNIILQNNSNVNKIKSFDEEFYKLLDNMSDLKHIENEETYKTLKKIRAQFNKEKFTIENEFKKFKTVVNNEFINQFDKQTQKVFQSGEQIDILIKAYEVKIKEEKRLEIVKIFDELNIFDWLTIEKVFKNNWLNQTSLIGDIKNEINNILYKIKDEIALLTGEEIEEYKSKLDLNSILNARAIEQADQKKRSFTFEINDINESQFKKIVEVLEEEELVYKFDVIV